MTSVAPAIHLSRYQTLRRIVWCGHVAVQTWAAFSLATWGFYHWVDLRPLGVFGTGLAWTWVLSVLALGWLAGPRSAGWRPVRWCVPKHPSKLTWVILLPTAALSALLLGNTWHYYGLLRRGEWNGGPVPLSLPLTLLLMGWAALSMVWLARGPCTQKDEIRRVGQGFSAFWLIGCVAVGLWFFGLQFHASPPPKSGPPVDLAVVLGHEVLPNGRAGPLLEDRAMGAVELYRRGQVRFILLSGAMHENPLPAEQRPPGAPAMLSEAVAAREVCLAHGVPEEALLLDPCGLNTRATVINSLTIMRQRGFKTVVAVSDDSHLLRIQRTYAAQGVQAYTYPCRHDRWPMAEVMAVAREVVGILVYDLRPHYRETEVARMAVKDPRIVVRKQARTLELFDGARLVKTYACITGKKAGNKAVEGDLRTPEGHFRICYKNPESKFHLSMGLDYPNISDAERGLREKLITPAEYEQIVTAIRNQGIPNWYTKLGGEIFIHGFAEGRSGTAGCIALSNPEIEELYAICDVGTPVEVVP